MRVCLTDRGDHGTPDLRSSGELAPRLAIPWIVKLRYGTLLGQAVLLLLTREAFGVQLPLAWCAVPLALAGASNLWLQRVTDISRIRPALGSILALDILGLTVLLALTGGPTNPFTSLYLVYITLSVVILRKAWSWALGLLSFACYGFLFRIHVPVSIFESHHAGNGFETHLIGMWMAFVVAALLVTVFIGKVSEALRQREQEVLSLQSQLARHERLASLATLAAGAAHELGSPLGTIAVVARDLDLHGTNSPRDPWVIEEAHLIRGEVERCRQILQQMSDRAAVPPGEVAGAIDLREVLERVRSRVSPRERERLQTDVKGGGRVVLCAETTVQALTALAKNALDASTEDQSVLLGADRTETGVRFIVQDRGRGMGPETLNRLGEPFFTTKAPGSGMGLGVYLVRTCAERLAGKLVFESESGMGTTAILELPGIPERHEVCPAQPTGASIPLSPGAAPVGREEPSREGGPDPALLGPAEELMTGSGAGSGRRP